MGHRCCDICGQSLPTGCRLFGLYGVMGSFIIMMTLGLGLKLKRPIVIIKMRITMIAISIAIFIAKLENGVILNG